MCGPAINDAPSYRPAEAPLGREVQREVLIPRWRTARPGAAPSDMGSVNLERMGPVFDREDTSLLDHDLMGRHLRRRLGGLHIARHYSTELSRLAYLQSGGAEALR